MAELFRPNAEGDPDDDNKESSKRPNPKKLAKLPLFPKEESLAPPEAVRRSVEFIPMPLPDTKVNILPEVDNSKEEDDDDSEESAEAPEAAAAFEKAEEALNDAETPHIDVEAAADMYDLSEDLIHLREPHPSAVANQQAEHFENQNVEEAPEPPAASPVGGGAPPHPPVPPSAESFSSGKPEEPRPASAARYGSAPGYQPSMPQFEQPEPRPYNPPEKSYVEASTLKRSTEEERKRNLRLVVIAGVATGLLLKAYLDGKTKGIKELLIDPLTEKVTDMAIDQLFSSKKTEKIARQGEQTANRVTRLEQSPPPVIAEALPAVQEVQELIFDQEGNQITLLPGQHVERSSGGYSVVLDEHNRVVYDAIHYGEAFKKDQKREQVSPDAFAPMGGGASAGSSSSDPFAGLFPIGGQQSAGTQSNHQADDSHTPVDINHRLSPPRNIAKETLTSPWLWIAIALIIIVYFIAALA